MPTYYIEREIRESIIDTGFFTKINDYKATTKRPYLLRAYFATAMDISEQKGFISHPWRQYWMGHSGDIESRYSTNKSLRDSEIEEMRSAYKKCLRYLETQYQKMNPEDKESLEKQVMESMFQKMFGSEEAEKLLQLPDEELKKELQKRLGNDPDPESIRKKALEDYREIKNKNRKQLIIPISAVDTYFEIGFEFVASIGENKAIMKLP